mmetsp:Transcript_6857/g.11767  ORF Transcript_6857/g.11767 Transcript_6857/m.11767 type:complete len:128 (-) Transcript_6857:281-664(-)|eukprot:CAMPEP_0196657518 /NCGR_PEP_ID=MMETSP1086-20130531/23917_1 /TAXON_ID=77921 /ORGANISM="Cyanoptyche  gloeocystis , Strain SAG4.97" /LENGTH=127 /DNA_ID=CAMNT_0041990689 /DNA_START=275 /DNA_END=658 /DNA_ORIENTATION=+
MSHEEGEDVRDRLNSLLQKKTFDAYDLHKLIVDKWGYSYDVQVRRVAAANDAIYVNIMWRYLEQQSFPLSQEEYFMNLQAIAELIVQWGAVDFFRSYVTATKEKPRVGKTVAIPMPLDSKRSSEFLF